MTVFAKTGAEVDRALAEIRAKLKDYKSEFKTSIKVLESSFTLLERKGFERGVKAAEKKARDLGNVVIADTIAKIPYTPGDEAP